MLECLILGDSIAVGTASYRPDCAAIVKGGITSQQFNSQYRKIDPAKVTVISLGTNDGDARTTKMTLETMRVRLGGAGRLFIWIIPHGPAAQIVRDLAEKYGDGAIERPADKLAWDKIHPTSAGYQEIAKKFVILPSKE